MTADTCWANPLSRRERLALARKLARACGDSYRARLDCQGSEAEILGYFAVSWDMADLHVDVTERAAVTR